MPDIEILITTYHKKDSEVIDIVKKANIFSNCIVRNQCEKNSQSEFMVNGYKVTYVCSNDVGLSKNRNELLKLSTAKYVMFLDDDCVIKNVDKKALELFCLDYDIVFCNCISLNSKRPLPVLKNHHNNNKFKYYSGCGIVGCLIRLSFLRLHCIFFDENLGSGTTLLCGEDSVFIKDVIKEGGNVGVTNLLTIEALQDQSLWFNKTLTDDYLFAKGYLYKRLYGLLWVLYGIRFLILNQKKHFLKSLKSLIKGSNFLTSTKRIGILSICDNNNYGNRLQNFALVFYLNERFNDVKARSFRYVCTEYSFAGYIKNHSKIFKNRNFLSFNNALPHYKNVIRRGCNFNSFKDVDYILIGSDQIWNERYFGLGILTNMLEKCDSINKISYAVSVGNPDYFFNKINLYMPLIKQFKNLSFREIDVSERANSSYSLSSCFNIDPVLLLERDKWMSMAECDTYPINKTYFCLFLNKNIDSSSLLDNEFGNNAHLNKSTLTKYDDPFDLIRCIVNCINVFTDSYHVFLFSLLFNKDLYLFVRDPSLSELDNRFTTIIKMLDLKYEKKVLMSKTCFIFKFSKLEKEVNEKLLLERKRSFEMFDSILNNYEK